MYLQKNLSEWCHLERRNNGMLQRKCQADQCYTNARVSNFPENKALKRRLTPKNDKQPSRPCQLSRRKKWFDMVRIHNPQPFLSSHHRPPTHFAPATLHLIPIHLDSPHACSVKRKKQIPHIRRVSEPMVKRKYRHPMLEEHVQWA